MRDYVARVSLLVGALLATHAVAADIYRYVDREGNVHYTNVPLDSRYRIHRRVDKNNPVTETLAGEIQHYDADHRKRYEPVIQSAARENNIDPALVHAVIAAESGYNPFARSHAGAAGLMQLMPDTARRYGAQNRLDPKQNIHAGVRYLRNLMDLFNNDLELALAAYNAGENAVIRAGHRIPPYGETMNFVPRVLKYYRHYRAAM